MNAEGKLKASQYDVVNQKLKGLRRNVDDCRFKAFRLLSPIFLEGVSSDEFAKLTDICQVSGSLKVCVQTQDVKFFGQNVRIPLTLAAQGRPLVKFIYGNGDFARILTDTGGEYPQQREQRSQVTLEQGELYSDVLSAKVMDIDSVTELAVEVCFAKPANSCMFFDGIFPN